VTSRASKKGRKVKEQLKKNLAKLPTRWDTDDPVVWGEIREETEEDRILRDYGGTLGRIQVICDTSRLGQTISARIGKSLFETRIRKGNKIEVIQRKGA